MVHKTEISDNAFNTVLRDLLERISRVFSAVRNIVGKKRFQVISNDFARQIILTDKGLQDFPAYIEDCGDSNHLPYLSDVALLEIKREKALRAKNEDVSGDHKPETFKLKNSVRLMASDWPVDEIYRHYEGFDQSGYMPSFKRQNVFLAIWRTDKKIHMQRLNALEYLTMLDLKSEQNANAHSLAKTQNPDFDSEAFLKKQLSLKTIQRI